jgi:hypothetical protein
MGREETENSENVFLLKVQRLTRPSSRVARLAVIAHVKGSRVESLEPGWVGEWASGLARGLTLRTAPR